MDIMSLPVDMIENILSYLSYDEIAKNRIVSKNVNEICMQMLNRGFLMIEKSHAQALKNVKSQLPRRESERRYHQLSRHCDILTSIETRISMLNMTYMKFIDHGLCCFIPGKIIDEIRRVLTIVVTESSPPRAHEVLQELRDISSMAMEHFDDKISPAFRRKLQESAHPQPKNEHDVRVTPLAMRRELMHLSRRVLLNAKLSLYLVSQNKYIYKQMNYYKKIASKQVSVMRLMAIKQRVDSATIADLKKRIDECDIKYRELTHTNQAVGGKMGGSKASEATSAQALRHFSSQIKLDLSDLPIGTSSRMNRVRHNMQPRKPIIKLPSLSDSDGEPPTKQPKPDITPSTSRPAAAKSAPTNKTVTSMMAKIRYMEKELRNCEGKIKLKRKMLRPDARDSKKLKID